MGPALRRIRDRVKPRLTQTALADKLKVHANTISAWEQGRATPSIESLDEYLEKCSGGWQEVLESVGLQFVATSADEPEVEVSDPEPSERDEKIEFLLRIDMPRVKERMALVEQRLSDLERDPSRKI